MTTTPGTTADAPSANRYSVLAAVMLGSIMGPIDSSIVNIVLPTVTQSFGVEIAAAQWVPMIYLLTISSLLLFFGRLGDILGYRRIYLSGLIGFVIASALCGLSPSIEWLVLSRGLQGLAAGMMMAVPFAIITASFPPTERGKAMGINAISISAGLAIGPSLGGFLTTLLGWRSVFFINIPVGIAGLAWGLRVIPDLKGQPGRIDLPGMATAALSLLCFLIGVNRSQGQGLTPETMLLIGIATLSGIGFLMIERRAPQPMMDLGLFRSVTFSFANISALLNFMSQYVMVFLTPFYLQQVLRLPMDRMGLIMTAFPLAVMAVAPFSGALSDRIGSRALTCLGAGTCALSLFLMAGLTAAAGVADVVWRVALFGIGTGMFQSPNISAAMGSVPKPRLGIASGVLATTRTVGMVLGIAAAGAVLYAFARPEALHMNPPGQADPAAFLSGLRAAYITGGILTATASLTSLITGGKDQTAPLGKET